MACISREGMIDHADALITRAEDMRADIDADYDNDTYEAILVELNLAENIRYMLWNQYLTPEGMRWAGERLDGIERALDEFERANREGA